jgi:hypothetical protein
MLWNWIVENWDLVLSSGLVASIVSVGANFLVRSYFENLRYKHSRKFEEWKYSLDLEVDCYLDKTNYHEIVIRVVNPNLISKKKYKNFKVEMLAKTGREGDVITNLFQSDIGKTGEIEPAGGYIESRIRIQGQNIDNKYLESAVVLFEDERNKEYRYNLFDLIKDVLDRLYISYISIGKESPDGEEVIGVGIRNPIPDKDKRLSDIEVRDMKIESAWIEDEEYGKFVLNLENKEKVFSPSEEKNFCFTREEIIPPDSPNANVDELISGKKRRLKFFMIDDRGKKYQFDKITYRFD